MVPSQQIEISRPKLGHNFGQNLCSQTESATYIYFVLSGVYICNVMGTGAEMDLSKTKGKHE